MSSETPDLSTDRSPELSPDLSLDLPRILPRAFQRAAEGASGDDQAAELLRVLDRQEGWSGIVRLRDWAMEALAPRPGETVVDVGSGTGVEVRRLATAVGPRGRAVGVEPHATLRAEAQRRAAGEGSAARFVDGEAEHLPFDDGSVDAVRSERVFQHLAEPEAAVAEIARVLRPGGRVVLLDTDWGTSVVHPADPDVLRRYHDAFRQNVAQPYAGRLLRTWLLRTGLEVAPVIGSSAVVLPDEVLRRPVLFMMNANAAVESGHLSREEADDLLAGVVEAAARGEAFGSVTMFGALARKPA